MAVFGGWSYEEIATPTIDYYALFELGMRPEAQRAFRFTDGDGRLLALRPDVTSGIARGAATLFAKRQRPLRFCYAAPVFQHAGTSRAEARREATQIGCELIGSSHQAADLEVLAIACEMFRRFDLARSFIITLNDVEIFNGIAEGLELDVQARHELRQLIDTRNTADLECFLKAYASAEESRGFAEVIQPSGEAEILVKARRVITNSRSLAALNRLESLWRTIESLELAAYFDIDLGDVARLDYYTGLTFKIYAEGAGARIGSGGRYDNLTANFGAAEPAVGFVCELDALTDLLVADRLNQISARSESAVLPVEDCDLKDAFHEVMRRRSCGERVQIKLGGAAS
jgi:ATP phosphoribosyltransferase regulatory subunit